MVGQIGMSSYHEAYCICGDLIQCSLKIRVGVGLRIATRLTAGLVKVGHKSLKLGLAGDWVVVVVIGVGLA